MDDLISRAEAIAWFFRPYSNEESYCNLDVKNALKAIPAVDAVLVVRCKDCKHWREPFDKYGGGNCANCELFDDSHAFNENFYCAQGERRD